MSTAIIVLGGHRSGTICVAGVLHHLGLPMGQQLLGPGRGNPAGHFEDVAFLRLHQRILVEDKDSRAWRRPSPDFGPARPQYRALVARRNLDQRAWGLKDPRLYFILPLLLEVHDGDVRVVHVHRRPDQSAMSLRARDGDLAAHEAEQIARAYHEAALNSADLASRRGPALAIRFVAIVLDPRRSLRKIAAFAELPGSGQRFENAVRFVDPASNHWKSC